MYVGVNDTSNNVDLLFATESSSIKQSKITKPISDVGGSNVVSNVKDDRESLETKPKQTKLCKGYITKDGFLRIYSLLDPGKPLSTFDLIPPNKHVKKTQETKCKTNNMHPMKRRATKKSTSS